MKRSIITAIFSILVGFCIMGATTIKPAIKVNGLVITNYEIEQRTLLLHALGAKGDVRELATEQLISDRLKIFAGGKMNLAISDEQVEEGVIQFALVRELDPEQVLDVLSNRNISKQTFDDFIKVGLLWREVIRARFQNRARQINEELSGNNSPAAKVFSQEVLLSEIAIPFKIRGPEKTMALANSLAKQLQNGGNFATAARKYSQSASAKAGGRVNWIPITGLPSEIATQLISMRKGEVTNPIPITRGTTILKLVDRRQAKQEAIVPESVSYAILNVPFSSKDGDKALIRARARARKLSRSIDTCTEIVGLAKSYGSGSGRIDAVPINEVPTDIALELAKLDQFETSINIAGANYVSLVMLCGRFSDETTDETANIDIRDVLINQRLQSYADNYLQELRADAVIKQ